MFVFRVRVDTGTLVPRHLLRECLVPTLETCGGSRSGFPLPHVYIIRDGALPSASEVLTVRPFSSKNGDRPIGNITSPNSGTTTVIVPSARRERARISLSCIIGVSSPNVLLSLCDDGGMGLVYKGSPQGFLCEYVLRSVPFLKGDFSGAPTLPSTGIMPLTEANIERQDYINFYPFFKICQIKTFFSQDQKQPLLFSYLKQRLG